MSDPTLQELAEKMSQRVSAVNYNLPSWPIVQAAINEAFPDPKQQNVITRIAKIVYLEAKGEIV